MYERKEEITVNISEEQTIIELSNCMQPFKSELYIQKVVQGSVYEINLKSLLGLINLQLSNGDYISVKAIGVDADNALSKVVNYLT
ncbi:phosphocarrier protein [Geomicrobium halophilum]|uniref:Phosphocarrier protein n=1 Tax=Geomicrobium halophilum TaxID=549000 RepID=A0A841PZP9_9BACL|nr:HPr family phosphocarrier protein [Geomicrobium halophilum]MBB6450523.1 phosphocarrier protein [Geomicrobium halophilum]